VAERMFREVAADPDALVSSLESPSAIEDGAIRFVGTAPLSDLVAYDIRQGSDPSVRPVRARERKWRA